MIEHIAGKALGALSIVEVAAVLSDHAMSGEPSVLSNGAAWVWRCVCRPEVAISATRSGALEAHRKHQAEQIVARVTSPAECPDCGCLLIRAGGAHTCPTPPGEGRA